MQVLRRDGDGVAKSRITAGFTASEPTLTAVCPTTRVFSSIIIYTASFVFFLSSLLSWSYYYCIREFFNFFLFRRTKPCVRRPRVYTSKLYRCTIWWQLHYSLNLITLKIDIPIKISITPQPPRNPSRNFQYSILILRCFSYFPTIDVRVRLCFEIFFYVRFVG